MAIVMFFVALAPFPVAILHFPSNLNISLPLWFKGFHVFVFFFMLAANSVH